MIQNKIQLIFFLAGILSKASCDLDRIVLIKEPKTWIKAKSYCREKYMDLATVQSDEDRAKLKEAADAVNFKSVAWIGFYRDTWRWSYQNMSVSYEMWDSSDPNMLDTEEACVVLVEQTSRWRDRDCTNKYGFICQTDTQDTLQNKFKYIAMKMSWHDAQIHCRTHYADLAAITDDTENTFLTNILSNMSLIDAWIGLHKNPWIPWIPWLWSDNSSVSWSSMKWGSGQPDLNGIKDCVTASTEGLMANDSCSTLLPFYCREHRRIQRVRFTVKSDGDLDESAVMEAIEKKMKEILSDQDMEITSSIKWSVQPDGKIFQQQKTQENTQETPCEELDPMKR
uniref:C-type lectin domain-containing protein n=2 Tax=Cyprinus carpio carpio TaxID=630221 RepID=A0A9J8BHR1_CYPCA